MRTATYPDSTASALRLSAIYLFVIVCCLSAVAARAQTSGSITGEVADQSGVVAPNAPGIYSFPDLTPRTYDVKVAAGFASIVKTNIEREVQVEQAVQTVEVSASASSLNSENASRFFFTTAFIGLPNTPSTGYTGADFLQDYITQTIIAVSLVSSDFRNSEWAAYVVIPGRYGRT